MVPAGQTLPVTIQATTGSLTVESIPAGAAVYLGETNLGSTPLALKDVPAGPVSLQVRQADFHPATVSGEIPTGRALTLQASLVSSLTEADYPVISFFRLKEVIGMAAKMHMEVNGQRFVTLGNGSYQIIRLKPGHYRFTADPEVWGQKSTTRELTVEPRRRYYFQTFPSETLMSRSAMLKLVPESEAQALLAPLTGNPTPQLVSTAPGN